MISRTTWDQENIKRLHPKLHHDSPVHLWHFVSNQKRQLALDMHYGCEVGIVCRGAMLRQYRNHERLVRPGGVWLCGLWEPHGGRITQAPCETFTFAVLPEMLALARYPEATRTDWAAPFMAPPQSRPRITPRTAPEMMNLIRYLKQNMRLHDGTLPPLVLRFAVMETLRILLQDKSPGSVKVSVEKGIQINKAVQLVFSKKGSIPIAAAARACGMSRSAFDHTFSKVMGISFHPFALRYRLHGVAGQLLSTRKPLKAIALEWGFTDASHLVRRFKECFDCTPKDYRDAAIRHGTH